MAKCEICGKSTAFGNTISHSHRVTGRIFRPNLQKTVIYEEGRRRRIVACTKCLKKLYRS